MTGVDIAKEMIEKARATPGPACEYVNSPIETLPFPDDHFDGATAFTAFHWFNNEKAVAETCRIVKPGKAFCVVHRRQSDQHRETYRQTVENIVGRTLPSVYENFDPKKSLEGGVFQNITVKEMVVAEDWLLKDYVDYFESTSLWNYLPEGKRGLAREMLTKRYLEMFPGGLVRKTMTITMVAGYKE